MLSAFLFSIAQKPLFPIIEWIAGIFDMFYSGTHRVADSRRSLGLGLSLCKSIVTAHQGTITVADNTPHGAVFQFTLPAEEVELHE